MKCPHNLFEADNRPHWFVPKKYGFSVLRLRCSVGLIGLSVLFSMFFSQSLGHVSDNNYCVGWWNPSLPCIVRQCRLRLGHGPFQCNRLHSIHLRSKTLQLALMTSSWRHFTSWYDVTNPLVLSKSRTQILPGSRVVANWHVRTNKSIFSNSVRI